MNPPKSVETLKLQGTYRAGRHAAPAPRPGAAPPPPKALTKEERAKWRELAKLLAGAGILTALDADRLALYVQTWCERERLRAKVREDGGETYRTASGLIRRHPGMGMIQTATNNLAGLGEGLGLSPGGRLRLRVPPKAEEPDPFADWEREQRARGAGRKRGG